MRIIRFVFEDIKGNVIGFFWNIIQIFAVCVMVAFLFESVFSYNDVRRKVDYITEQSEVYMFRNNTSLVEFDDDSKTADIRQIVEYTEEQVESKGGCEMFCADSGVAFYYDDNLRSKFKNIGTEDNRIEGSVPRVSVTSNFFEVFNIEVKGHNDTFGKVIDGVENVFAGAALKGIFDENEIITDFTGNQYRITGFLEEGSYYIAPGEGRDPVYLDSYILTLKQLDKEDMFSMLTYLQTVYFITNNNQIPEEIALLANDKGIMLKVINYSYQMKAVTSDLKDKMILYGTIALVFLIFCIVAMTSNILNFISSRRRDFAIHQMCGADKSENIERIIMQIGIEFVVAVVLLVVIKSFSKALIASVVFAFVYIMCIAVVPVVILNKESIQGMLRKSYE